MRKAVYIYALFISLMLIATTAISQNLISNPDFESYSMLPTDEGQILRAEDWDEVVRSADYLNTTYNGWTPHFFNAYSGTGFTGFATYGDENGAAEAIGQSINSPLLPNTVYKIEVYAKKTSGPSILGNYSENCGGLQLIGFENSPARGNGALHTISLNGAFSLWTSETVSSTSWVKYEGCFQAPFQINYIVLTLERNPGCRQYAYVDSFSIEFINDGFSLGPDITLCEGDTTILNASTPGAIYTWQDGTSDSIYVVTEEDVYTATLDLNSCQVSDAVRVKFNPLPTLELGTGNTLCEGDSTTLYLPFNSSTYLWQDSSTNTTFKVKETGWYFVESTLDDCISTDSVYFEFEDCTTILELPNIFTPNNDGFNDLLTPVQSKHVVAMQTTIYDRWGNMVFYTADPEINWSGNSMTDGTYYWIIYYRDSNRIEHKRTGYVLLTR